MAKYSIQDTSLIAIGDAIRNKSGEHTRVEYIPKEVWIFKTNNVNSLEEAMNFDTSKRGGFTSNVTEVITIPGAVKLVLQMVLTKYAYDNGYKLPEYSGDTIYGPDINRQLCEYEITGDTITIQTVGCEYGGGANAFYAEVRGYDGNGNLIKDENTLVEIVVPNTFTPAQMATEIEGLSTILEEAFVITGNCSYRFANDGWNWLIEHYGDKITTKDISLLSNFASGSTELTNIPFDLNITKDCKRFDNMFSNCYKLIEVPKIIGHNLTLPTTNYSGADLSNLFSGCKVVKEIPHDYFYHMASKEFWEASKNYAADRDSIFYQCHSLRKLPDISMLASQASSYSCLYYSLAKFCYSLGEIRDLPVLAPIVFTSNTFASTVEGCNRLKALTFETNVDGTPKTAQWSKQGLDLTKQVGYFSSSSALYGNSIDKLVEDDTTYQALKNDPDWWTGDINYSRYNKLSAIETINSLPDVTSGSGNTITFKGEAGALTDGGAINTLTEEEIAVAAAKGWTVSFK